MKSMYELKEKLCRELDEIAMQKDLTESSLDIIDKLTHSIKSIETIIAMNEAGRNNSRDSYNSREGYGSRDSYNSMNSMETYLAPDGRSMMSTAGGYSERRGRDAMGRYTSRDGYSGHGDTEKLKHELEDIYKYTQDEQSRNMISKWLKEL